MTVCGKPVTTPDGWVRFCHLTNQHSGQHTTLWLTKIFTWPLGASVTTSKGETV